MKQLSQLGATAKGLPLQFITLRRGNPFEAKVFASKNFSLEYGCPNYFMHVPKYLISALSQYF